MLTSLHSLITRPQPQANELAAAIALQGGKSVIFPTFSIEDPLDKAALQNTIKTLNQADIAIFVSPNAAKKTLPLWLHDWPLPPKKLLIAAIGKSTQQALKSYLSVPILFPQNEFNSEALLSLPDLQNVEGKTVIIFQGESGRGLLESILTERGAKVIIAIAYRRVLSSSVSLARASEWRQSGVNCVIYTSAEGMLNLFKLVEPSAHHWLKKLPSLVISSRLVEMAREIKIQTIIQSCNAHTNSIVEALAHLSCIIRKTHDEQ